MYTQQTVQNFHLNWCWIFLEKKVEEKKNMCEKYGEGRGEEYLKKDDIWSTEEVREVFKKSKWKFKMAFAMKGGGRDRSRVPHTYFEK